MKPSIGRIVHYVSYGTPGGEYGKACRAAIVTEIPEQTKPDGPNPLVGLAVLNPTGMFFNQAVPYHPGPGAGGGTWHWPERVDG